MNSQPRDEAGEQHRSVSVSSSSPSSDQRDRRYDMPDLSRYCPTDQHIPGPWRLGKVLINVSYGKSREIRSDEGVIGLVYGTDDPCNVANARLIAAAPDMLATLRQIAALDYTQAATNGAAFTAVRLAQDAISDICTPDQ